MQRMAQRKRKKIPMETQVVVRMPRELQEALARAAGEERRPVANFIRVLLEDGLAVRKKRGR